jgi:hypothetical protein
MAVVDVFAETGMLAYRDGVLPDALAELAVRLDLAGAGPLLDQLTATCFAAHVHGVCPVCGHKQDPGKPHPKPKPPPKPQPKGHT